MQQKIKRFVKDMREEYGMSKNTVLQAIQEESQHDFLVKTQSLTIREAGQVIRATEDYLMEELIKTQKGKYKKP